MNWQKWIAAGAALGLVCAHPLAAAAPKKGGDAVAMSAFTDMFKADPLTPEQAARLPAAKALMLQIMPPGTMAEMYHSLFKRFLDPIMKLADSETGENVAKNLGQEPDRLSLTDAQAKQANAILDSDAAKRDATMVESLQVAMSKAMTALEPAMREGMADAYAVNFNNQELADIGAFFATPSGMAYARRSFTLASDPHVLSATMKSLPKLMGELGPMKARIDKAVADVPPPRSYEALSAVERQQLAKLTGLTQAEIKAGMIKAAKSRAEKADPDRTKDDSPSKQRVSGAPCKKGPERSGP